MPPRARQPARAKSSGAPSPAAAERTPATPTASPTSADFEKLGVFYLGRPYDLAAKQPRDGPPALRLEGSRHPRGLRRHDGQRQDGPLPRAHRGGRCSTAFPCSLIDPKGDLAESLPHLPRAPPGGLRARGSTRTTRGGRGSTADAYAAQQAELWRKGSPRGGRTARASGGSATRPTSPSTRRAAPAGLPVSIVKLVRGPARRGARRRRAVPRAHRDHRHEPPRAPRDRGRPAPEPRAHPAREALRGRVARRAGTSTCPASSSRSRTRRRQGGGARPRGVLPGEGPLRAGDPAQQPPRRARASTPGSRASRSTSARCSTRRRASPAPRSSRSRTCPTPSACSSSRSC